MSEEKDIFKQDKAVE